MVRKNRKEIKEILFDFSCGVLAGTIDVFLYFFFQSFNAGKYGYGSIAMRKAVEDSISEVESLGIDGMVVRKAIWRAIHGRFLIRKPDQKTIKITSEGLKRLNEIIPSYKKKRPWDGHLYLITYDVIEEKRQQRRILREYLKKQGCGMLQDSVWITPYNPKLVLKTFIQENSLAGSIIVSDIGKDGSIGDEVLDELVNRIYCLEKINQRYKDFIDELRSNKAIGDHRVYFQYLSILRDDPQLPFEILPLGWVGDEAYRLLIKKSSQFAVLPDGDSRK